MFYEPLCRRGVVLTLTCVVVVIVLIQGCAVVMATVAFNQKALPTEVSRPSNYVGSTLLK